MFRYIVRRILQFIPVFFFATLLIFAMVFAQPGDRIQALAGDKPVSAITREVLEDRYNLDEPLWSQYGKYIGVIPQDPTASQQAAGEPGDGFSGVLQGEFGFSLNQRPVSDIMATAIPITAKLGLMAFVFELILGVGAGILAGLRKGSFMDSLVLISTLAVISIPVFVLGYLGQIIFGVTLGWAPINAAQGGFGELVLPAMVLGATSLAYIARLTRSSLHDNLRQDYVKTATSKGLSRGRVIGRHALRNSLIPVITFLGIDLGALMGGAIITEGIFNIPGLGRAIFLGIQQSDGAVVVGISTFLIVIFMVSNLVVDVMYAWLDPRIRYE